MNSRRLDVGVGGVSTVVFGEANGRTRMIVNVDALLPFNARTEGKSVFLTIQPGKPGSADVAAGRDAGWIETSGVRDVHFVRLADGGQWEFGVRSWAKEPGHWRGGFDLVVMREAVRNFVQEYGDSIVQVVKAH